MWLTSGDIVISLVFQLRSALVDSSLHFGTSVITSFADMRFTVQIKETYFLEVGMTLDTLSVTFRRTSFHFSVVTNISLIFIFKDF